MKTPLVSVVMPVFNSQSYLDEAVKSILAQSLADFEFIIIDDGSTDQSLKMLRSYERLDSRIRLISRPNTGLCGALNEALGLARGKFIARMDADDISLPERFAKQVEFLENHPEAVMVGTAIELIDGRGRRLLRPPAKTSDEVLQSELLEGNSGISHPTAMLRREPMVAAGGYDQASFPAEDLDLWLRLAEVGKLANLPEVLVRYRVHSNSISSSRQEQQMKQTVTVCERAWRRRGIPPRHVDRDRRWRPDNTRSSAHQFAMQFGWWAFSSGERVGALSYGARAIALLPWRSEGWRLVACALVKPMQRQPQEV
jgi:glycosyltransferase involved in cell wall biosynthesis